MELCSQTIFDILHASDVDVVKQQLTNERTVSTVNSEDLSNDSKCKDLLSLSRCDEELHLSSRSASLDQQKELLRDRQPAKLLLSSLFEE
jgi:hypothetical protein